jgi:myo-inositol-1(or 4)-monophosphatase
MSDQVFLCQAKEIIKEAGSTARRYFGHSPTVATKPGGDLVTRADEEVQDYVLGRLRGLYPNHGFVAEERRVREREDAEYVWILDPIDGTKYYARGVALYSISLALQRDGNLILGAVYSPQTEQMFSGIVGQGATLGDDSIHCSAADELSSATICVEIPNRHSPAEDCQWALEKLGVLVPHVQRVRILGVSALGLCYCAANGFDAYVNLGNVSYYWDIAAGWAILTAAGGRFVKSKKRIVAGPPVLCKQLLDLLGLQDENGHDDLQSMRDNR